MSEIDLSPLKENYTQYDSLASVVEEKYKCSWDDVVHDSYERYVKQIREYANEIKTVNDKAESILREIKEMDIPELISHANDLCEEVEEV